MMKRLAIILGIVLLTVPLLAQTSGNINRTLIRPEVGYGSFSFGDETRSGPLLTLQYMPTRRANPAWYFSGGVMFRFTKQYETSEFGFPGGENLTGATKFSHFDVTGNRYDTRLHMQTAMGYVGSGLMYAFAEGDFVPYAGFGVVLPFWSYTSRLNIALAPEAKLGLDVRFKESFSGFAEVRHMIGIPTLLGSGPKFDGLTSVSVGISFSPKLK